jgi:signal transduction histidine kinase
VKQVLAELTPRYAEALRSYFEGGGESPLLDAYQLGRAAIARGVSVLEMAALHQEALVAALLRMMAPQESTGIARKASEFFAEALAPFEMTRRGFQEANALLRDMNRELEQRASAALDDVHAARSALDELRRVERMKDEFISIVSHELRTPLTSIYGSLGLLMADPASALAPRTRQLLEVAHRNSQRLVRLVSEVLDLQKLESGALTFDLRAIEVAPFLQHAIEANQSYAGQFGVTLAFDGAPAGLWLRADADRLMQVMTNLLSNAARFSPPDEPVAVSAAAADAGVRVSVRDRGPGIPEAFQPRVFERFAQADASTTRPTGGTGLGLSICKALVEGMGGRIGFQSRPGDGCSFFFELPAAAAPEAAAAGCA